MSDEPIDKPAGRSGTTALWRSIRSFIAESLKDNQEDFTTGPLGRALGLLAIPMMLEMSMEAIFAIVDIAFVSRLGTDAVAAVGITEALITVLYAIAIGLGTGVTAMVSRRIGAHRPDAAAHVAGQALWVGAAFSLVIGIAGAAQADEMLRLMGADAMVIATGSGFTAVMLGGSASILFLFLLNAAFRGAGDAPIALRALTIANGANIVLDPCLIFGVGPFPEMGVTGAAVATTIGRSIGVLYLLRCMYSDRGRLRLHALHLRPDVSIIRRMLMISAGGVGQFLIATSSWIAVMRVVAIYGSGPIAAYTIALRIIEFAILPAWGLGNAAATLVGQNLGAGKPERARRSAWIAARWNVAFMTLLGVMLLMSAPEIVSLFSSQPDVLKYGANCLRILGIGYPAYAIGMVVVQALNGAGDTRSPAVINLLCFWVVQIPLAYWSATVAGLGPNGVFLAIVISETLLSAFAVLYFRTGRWQRQKA